MYAKKFIGKKIGDFKIKSIIGEGAFSTVCLAEKITSEVKESLKINLKNNNKKPIFELKTKRNKNKLSISKQYAACKIVPRKKVEEKKLSTRLDQEIRIHQMMHHPNVVQLIDVQKDASFYYIFLEFCPCGELFQHVIKNKKLEEKEAASFFKQILIGLQYIHSLNVAHRDLKPENILIDQFGRIKIADFGLSKLLDINSNGLTKTPCGSPCYASPECISGHPYDGRKSDIWSCGVILYALTTGLLPWTKRTQAKLFQQIKRGEYTVPIYISKNCNDLICRLMTVDNDARISIEEALNHPFLKDVKVMFSKFEPRFVSLRKIDQFLSDEDDFEYSNLSIQNLPQMTISDSKIELNFLKARKGIESEKEKRKLKLRENSKNEIQAFRLSYKKESENEMSLDSLSDESSELQSNKIYVMNVEKEKKCINNNDKKVPHLPLIITPRAVINKYIVVNQYGTAPHSSRRPKRNQIPIIN